jgi:hypothetical protein
VAIEDAVGTAVTVVIVVVDEAVERIAVIAAAAIIVAVVEVIEAVVEVIEAVVVAVAVVVLCRSRYSSKSYHHRHSSHHWEADPITAIRRRSLTQR